jgi:hypothetical protein
MSRHDEPQALAIRATRDDEGSFVARGMFFAAALSLPLWTAGVLAAQALLRFLH